MIEIKVMPKYLPWGFKDATEVIAGMKTNDSRDETVQLLKARKIYIGSLTSQLFY